MSHESVSPYAASNIARQPHNNGNLIRPPSAMPSASNLAAREQTDLEGLMDFQNNLTDRMRNVVLRLHDVRQKITPQPGNGQSTKDAPEPHGHFSVMRSRFEDQSQLISGMESLLIDLEKAL